MGKMIGWIAVAVLVFGALGSAKVEAATTDTMNVTVTISASLSITMTPSTWAVGNVAESAVCTSDTTGTPVTIGVTNDSNYTAKITIQTGNSANWTAEAAAGTDQFLMECLGGDLSSYTDIDSAQNLDASIAAHTRVSDDPKLRLSVPTITTVGGTEQTIVVTVTVSAP